MLSHFFSITDSSAFTSGKSTKLFWITTPSPRCLHFHTSYLSHSSHLSHQSHNCPTFPALTAFPFLSALPALPFLPQSSIPLALPQKIFSLLLHYSYDIQTIQEERTKSERSAKYKHLIKVSKVVCFTFQLF